jgi:4-amino-4-deoxy-L-arabinose transferase-like glycosyltransferase
MLDAGCSRRAFRDSMSGWNGKRTSRDCFRGRGRSRTEGRGTRGYTRNLLIITAVGLFVRLVCLDIALPISLTGDEVYYATVARNIAEGYGHMRAEDTRASWPPANSYFLSLFIRSSDLDRRLPVSDEAVKRMLTAQAILGGLLVPLSMLLSRRLFGDRAAVLTGLITAFYPDFVAFSHYLWAENLFVVLTTAGFAAVVWAQQTGRRLAAAAAGAIFGLATLTRETGFVTAAACGIWWVWTASCGARRRAFLRCVLMLAVMASTILPWTIRNYRVLGGFVPVSTVGWMALSEGNILDPDDWLHPNRDLLLRYRTSQGKIKDELKRMEYSREVGLELIRSEQPTWFFKKFIRTSALMFSPDSFLFKKISRGTYGDVPLEVIRVLLVVAVLSYIFVIAAGTLGIAAAPDRGRRLLPCLVVGGLFLVHLVANASSRYRLPFIPLLIPYASYALIRWRYIRHDLRRRRWIAPVVLLLWFSTVCVPYFYGDAVSLWRQGTYVNYWRP